MKLNSVFLLAVCAFFVNSMQAGSFSNLRTLQENHTEKEESFRAPQEEEFSPDPCFELPQLIEESLKALTADRPNPDTLQTLQESWSTLQIIPSKVPFADLVSCNFQRVEKYITDPRHAYLSLGFSSPESMTATTSRKNFRKFVSPLYTLKSATNLNSPKIKSAALACKKNMQRLYLSPLIKQDSLPETLGAIENLNPENLTLDTLQTFLTATDAFACIVRQTRYFRTEIGIELFKAYCQGEKPLAEKIALYETALENHALTPELILQIVKALSSKQENYALPEEAQMIEVLTDMLPRCPSPEQSTWQLSLETASQAWNMLCEMPIS